jgi:hypothetical protein
VAKLMLQRCLKVSGVEEREKGRRDREAMVIYIVLGNFPRLDHHCLIRMEVWVSLISVARSTPLAPKFTSAQTVRLVAVAEFTRIQKMRKILHQNL